MRNRYLEPRRIEFLVTYLCNGRCIHCYAPKKKEEYPQHIDASLAVDIVENVCRVYDVESVMTFGGEPMLFPEVVCSIHREATRHGVSGRELITNGCWSEDVRVIREVANDLENCGVNQIYFSVDAFHQEYIPIDRVRVAIESCLEAGIEDLALNPCWLVSEDDDNEYNRETRSILDELSVLPLRVSGGNVVEPSGLALVNLKEYLPTRVRVPPGRCGDMPHTEPLNNLSCISVEPDGRVAVCDGFYLGDASESDILRLIEGYDPFDVPEMRAIIDGGVEELASLVRARGVEPDPDGYYSVCHMCTDLRGRLRTRCKSRT
ncbi:MAG: radical SAM protein [Candidatus Bathyarchaeota archaeon]|nr:radical SAM protein [Candidatus Bathyarchaeota archaeon]